MAAFWSIVILLIIINFKCNIEKPINVKFKGPRRTCSAFKLQIIFRAFTFIEVGHGIHLLRFVTSPLTRVIVTFHKKVMFNQVLFRMILVGIYLITILNTYQLSRIIYKEFYICCEFWLKYGRDCT